jgi:hypothetical protein
MPNLALRSTDRALVLHAGAHEATREQIFETKTPEATKTFTPISHGGFLSIVTSVLLGIGLTIQREAFGLWRDNQRMFGVLQVANGKNPDDYAMLVGLRNSHDHSFAASLALGSLVFVCDNMAFSGEVTLSRMHTAHIMRDLPGLVNTGIAKLNGMRGYQDKRIAAYKDVILDNKDASHLIIEALRNQVINVQRVDDVVREWYTPSHEDFAPRTGWSLFNAFTEALKGSGAALQPRTLRLHGMLDTFAGLPSYASLTEIEAVEIGEGKIVVEGQEIRPSDN